MSPEDYHRGHRSKTEAPFILFAMRPAGEIAVSANRDLMCLGFSALAASFKERDILFESRDGDEVRERFMNGSEVLDPDTVEEPKECPQCGCNLNENGTCRSQPWHLTEHL